MRILALEPYYGGSHRVFLDEWIRRSQHRWELLTLPAHHWKWRMRHAPLWFAEEVRRLWAAGSRWDMVFCSDMLDLAQLRGLVSPDVAPLPCLVYFHENQLTYPTRCGGERDLHFAFTNFTTAVAADRVWFNSQFHRRSFLTAVRRWLTAMPDHIPRAQLAAVETKSSVESPGVDVADRRRLPSPDSSLRIAWAARWEHDKNPKTFFDALRTLQQWGVDFRLTVCGQRFREVPHEFAAARAELASHIDHWGPVPSRAEYLDCLSRADVFVSTALHEFFGLAVMESIALGLFPLLPERLSYPELLGLDRDPAAQSFFYDGTPSHLARRLAELSRAPRGLTSSRQEHILASATRTYHWSHRAAAMDAALLGPGGRGV